MTTIVVPSRMLSDTLIHRGPLKELAQSLLPPHRTLVENLGYLSRVLLGVLLLLFAGALTLTLVLLPIGLPLALVALALIAAPAHP
jgi:hypothetical protein